MIPDRKNDSAMGPATLTSRKVNEDVHKSIQMNTASLNGHLSAMRTMETQWAEYKVDFPEIGTSSGKTVSEIYEIAKQQELMYKAMQALLKQTISFMEYAKNEMTNTDYSAAEKNIDIGT